MTYIYNLSLYFICHVWKFTSKNLSPAVTKAGTEPSTVHRGFGRGLGIQMSLVWRLRILLGEQGDLQTSDVDSPCYVPSPTTDSVQGLSFLPSAKATLKRKWNKNFLCPPVRWRRSCAVFFRFSKWAWRTPPIWHRPLCDKSPNRQLRSNGPAPQPETPSWGSWGRCSLPALELEC